MTDRDAPPRNEAPGAAAWEVVTLSAITATVVREAETNAERRAARSLFQGETLGAVVTALRPGATVENNDPDEACTVQGLEGSCTILVDGLASAVERGTLVAIPRGDAWRLEARTDAVVLLTVARS